MNTTIEKIVGLLFEDLVLTDEVNAIREEILQNCQERYQDLREAGLSEDDAIAAVIESLSGMEEMLSEYPRKEENEEHCDAERISDHYDEETGCYLHSWLVDPAQKPVREIRLERMVGAEVTIKPSDDELIHVECESDNPETDLLCGMEGGVLTIALAERAANRFASFAREHFGQNWMGLSNLSHIFDDFINRVATTDAFSGEIQLTLYLPDFLSPALHVHTAEGTVEVKGLTLERFDAASAGGDITLDHVTLRGELHTTTVSGTISVIQSKANRALLLSTSGSIDVIGSSIAEKARINSTSGDITWLSDCRELELRSVSGDAEVRGLAESISFNSVSGNAEIYVQDTRLQQFKAKTVSGDVDVFLPEGRQAELRCSSISGSITTRIPSIPDSSLLITISTTSGDIEVK